MEKRYVGVWLLFDSIEIFRLCVTGSNQFTLGVTKIHYHLLNFQSLPYLCISIFETLQPYLSNFKLQVIPAERSELFLTLLCIDIFLIRQNSIMLSKENIITCWLSLFFFFFCWSLYSGKFCVSGLQSSVLLTPSLFFWNAITVQWNVNALFYFYSYSMMYSPMS